VADEQVAAGGHGQHPGFHPEQAGEQLTPPGAGRTGDHHRRWLRPTGLAPALPGRQRRAERRLDRPNRLGQVDRAELARLHQAAFPSGDRPVASRHAWWRQITAAGGPTRDTADTQR
jgi:hypothetical protein